MYANSCSKIVRCKLQSDVTFLFPKLRFKQHKMAVVGVTVAYLFLLSAQTAEFICERQY